MKSLYVIGNGFDLHHGIKCSYRDFLVWMGVYFAALLEKMIDIVCSGETPPRLIRDNIHK